MKLSDEIAYFKGVFYLLQDTNSRNEKEDIVSKILPEFKDDFNYIIECLNGKHKFGYKYYKTSYLINDVVNSLTIKQALEFLQTPINEHDLSRDNIETYVSMTNAWYDFFEPIVNRTLKLGIGNSLIEKTDVSPMLAKKYEGQTLHDNNGIFVTEKLDGNRCIAQFVGDKWVFTSRNGKEMYVDFDMSAFDKSRIYDGEVMSIEQTLASAKRKLGKATIDNTGSFNSTSGLINRHDKNKDMIYNIFDIVDTKLKYYQRREELDNYLCQYIGNDVRILPVLQVGLDGITDRLDYITSTGGEGLMINLGSGLYQQKRTNDLLKVKKVQTMDMRVVDIEFGNGKYADCVGNLICEGEYNGNKISCKVGTGLSDEQRIEWSSTPEKIIGKIVEVAYFSLSQNFNTLGTTVYSLRFPRLKSIRSDKNETSEY